MRAVSGGLGAGRCLRLSVRCVVVAAVLACLTITEIAQVTRLTRGVLPAGCEDQAAESGVERCDPASTVAAA